MRNKLKFNSNTYDFELFFTTFGNYIDPKISRIRIDLINEIERQLNKMCQESFGKEVIINPYKGTGYCKKDTKVQREKLMTPIRKKQLELLIKKVFQHIK